MPRKKHVAVDFCYHLLVGLDMGGRLLGVGPGLDKDWTYGRQLERSQRTRCS